MVDDLPEDKEENAEAKAPNDAAATKSARIVWAVWGVFLLFALYTLGGIATALLSDVVDPSTVKMAAAPEIKPATAVPTPAAPEAPAPIPYPYEEPQYQVEETFGDAPAQVEEKPVEQPVAPQSRIEWEKFPKTDKPKIAVVIDDMGLNHRNSLRVVALPAALTLAYLPYAENLPKQTSDARGEGHELLVHMPMEPSDLAHNNPGPNALLRANSTDENLKRMASNLQKFEGYIGINNHMGSAFTKDREAILPVMQALKDKGLWFLDSKTVGSSVAGEIAQDLGIPSVERDVFLDNVADVTAILRQLKETEAIARKRGYAVAIGHPHNETIQALQQWTADIEARGFEVVPLSQIIEARYPEAPVPQYARAKKSLNEIVPAAGLETAANVFDDQGVQ
jgi:polysaccharide deacetylase 2 family uncharacterized protein YibQ